MKFHIFNVIAQTNRKKTRAHTSKIEEAAKKKWLVISVCYDFMSFLASPIVVDGNLIECSCSWKRILRIANVLHFSLQHEKKWPAKMRERKTRINSSTKRKKTLFSARHINNERTAKREKKLGNGAIQIPSKKQIEKHWRFFSFCPFTPLNRRQSFFLLSLFFVSTRKPIFVCFGNKNSSKNYAFTFRLLNYCMSWSVCISQLKRTNWLAVVVIKHSTKRPTKWKKKFVRFPFELDDGIRCHMCVGMCVCLCGARGIILLFRMDAPFEFSSMFFALFHSVVSSLQCYRIPRID